MLDFGFIIKSIPQYVKAIGLTLNIAFWGIFFSIIIGILCSLAIYNNVKFFGRLSKIYVEISRNTPLLIQLFFLYYGLPRIGVKLDSLTCAILGLSFLGGSYMCESFRAGIGSVGRHQIEAGLSIGLEKGQISKYILLPQALAVAMPSVGANIIFLIKEVSIVSAIALADLMFVAKDIIGMYYKTNEALILLVTCYLIILLPISFLVSFLERRVNNAWFGT